MNNQGNVYGYGLYYPYIHFQDENWIKTAVLYYDGLKRIVPEGYKTHDSRSLKLLNDEFQFVEDLDPREYVEEVANGFLQFAYRELADTDKRTAIQTKIGQSLPPKYGFQIHMQKMADVLRVELPRIGLAERSSESSPWYRFEPVTGAIYMTCLANKMAEDRGLPIVTDEPAYQPLVRWFQGVRPQFSQKPKADTGHALASLVIETAVPENIESVSIKQVVKFRRKHNDERRRFYKEIVELTRDIPKIDNQDAFKECLNYHKKGIDEAVSDLRRSLAGVKIQCVTGLLGLSAPSWATNLAQVLPGSQMQIITAGIVCAAAGILIKQGFNYYRSRRNSSWSYVLSLKRGIHSRSLLRKLLEDTVLL